MAFLSDELADLTVRELVEEHGADFAAEETVEGFDFFLKVGSQIVVPNSLNTNQLEMEF